MKALDSSPQEQKDFGAGHNVKPYALQQGGLQTEAADSDDSSKSKQLKALDCIPQEQEEFGGGQNVKAQQQQQQQEGGLKRKQAEEEGDSEDDLSYEEVLKRYVAREEVWQKARMVKKMDPNDEAFDPAGLKAGLYRPHDHQECMRLRYLAAMAPPKSDSEPEVSDPDTEDSFTLNTSSSEDSGN